MDNRNEQSVAQQSGKYSQEQAFMKMTAPEQLKAVAEADGCKEVLFPRLSEEIAHWRRHIGAGSTVGGSLLTDIALLLAVRLRNALVEHTKTRCKEIDAWEAAAKQKCEQMPSRRQSPETLDSYDAEFCGKLEVAIYAYCALNDAYRDSIRQATLAAFVLEVALKDHGLSVTCCSAMAHLTDAVTRMSAAESRARDFGFDVECYAERLCLGESRGAPTQNKPRSTHEEDREPESATRRSSAPAVYEDDRGGYEPDDYSSSYPDVNPASGLPMIGNSPLDVGGNIYGTNQW